MRITGSRRALRASVALFTVALAVVSPAVAWGNDAGFKDPHAMGALGFCGKDNKPVTSGRIGDVPFVWKYVSDEAAPTAYRGAAQKAAIYAFSPLPNSNPGDWVGYQMTASSPYSNFAAPMAAATLADPPLEWQNQSFPPALGGLVQLRMILSNVDTAPRTVDYAAAVIKVTGNTWTLVSGIAKPACDAGVAKSSEELHLPPSAIPTATPSWANAPATGTDPSPGSSAQPTSSSSAAVPMPVAAGESAAPEVVDAASVSDSSPSGLGTWPVLLGLGVVGLVIGAFVFGRTSSSRNRDPR
ncbi:MAG: hypothetical protein WCO67_11260 [Betaproteobacteria bacterium]